jgi:hypothetical protein
VAEFHIKGFVMRRNLLFIASLALFAAPALVAADTAKQPVYIYLYASVTDHVNMDLTVDRLRRLLPMLEKYRKAHPEAHVSATVLFSGAVSEALAQRNSQSHILSFVRDYIRRGIIQVGYNGADEPTYEHRPAFDFFKAETPQDRWLVREAAYEKFLTEARDPLTGAPQPGKSGGLKRVREVFGDVAAITGMMMFEDARAGVAQTNAAPADFSPSDPHFAKPLTRRTPPTAGLIAEVGGDSELVQLLRRDKTKAIMFGIPDTNPAGLIPGFGEGRTAYGKFMSPVPEAAPELYWQDDILRTSESSGTVRLVHASDGADAMKAAFGKMDRSTVHVIHVELASEQNYLQPAYIKGSDFPPVKFAYNHPQSPLLAQEARLPTAGVEAAYAKEDALLKWLVEDFPTDAGSRVVSNTDLMTMVGPSTGFSIAVDGLRAALSEFVKATDSNTYMPPLFQADGHYLSLANTFQVMADALAEFSRTGRLPQSVKVTPINGPVRLLTGHGPNQGEVSVASVVRACVDLQPGLHDLSPGTMPKNAIPVSVGVDGIRMTPAQFLRLMAQALQNPSASPDTKLAIKMLYPLTGPQVAYPRTRPAFDAGFGWTLKPAPLQAALLK